MAKAPAILPIEVKSTRGTIPCLWNGEVTNCRSCGAFIGFALTDKNKKWIPFDAQGKNTGVVQPHWATCPNADKHRS